MADWASGGSWSEPDPVSEYPSTAERTVGSFGESRAKGAHGIVAGRFDPLHRGHQYVIECARASVEKLTVFVFDGRDTAIAARARAQWIRELYRDVEVVVVARPIPEGANLAAEFVAAVKPHAAGASHLFGSELAYAAAARALGAAFVPVDPARATVPISGTAIRANVMETFGFLAPPARPWFIRRVAVVGAESTGKTTLCARLRAELKVPVVPEWTRVVLEAAGRDDVLDRELQHIARLHLASEDALARQSDSPVLVSDTDLLTLWLWAKRLYQTPPPGWIEDALLDRSYDLVLLCMPEIPFVGAMQRDQPEQRRIFHAELAAELGRRGARVVEVAGSRDERFQIAADAIISLYTPASLTAARAVWLTARIPR